METEGKLRLADVFVSITDPRQTRKTRHDLVEVLVVAVNGVLAGADTFVEIEAWATRSLNGFAPTSSLSMASPLMTPSGAGKTSRRSGKVDATALHLVSAFAVGAGLQLS